MSLTPNMNLTLPTPTSTVGPEWAEELNTAIETIDDHDHSSGKGQRVTPAGLDINADLDVNDNDLVNVNTLELVNQSSELSGVDHACTIQFVNGNFYIVNSGGTPVQITNGNDIVNTTIVPSSPLMPSGTVLDFAGSTIPVGFLPCDGSAVSRVTYSDLFTAIGTTWGVGDGSTTFNVPNFCGRASIGSGTYTDSVSGSITRSVAQAIGAAAHVLTTAQMPSHTHIQNAHSHTLAQFGTRGFAPESTGGYFPSSGGSEVTGSSTATNQTAGGDTAHNNMQPSLVVNKMIKY